MAYKVDYAELARIFNERGEKGTRQYLKEECGVSCIYKPIKILKKKYTYDEDMKKLIIPEDLTPVSEPFLSIDELCASSDEDVDTTPAETCTPPNTIIPSSQATAFNDLINIMLMEKLQEYSEYITIDHIQRVCHINKSRLIASGFTVHVF